METLYVDLHPQPNIDSRHHDHLHWAFQQNNEGLPKEQTENNEFGTVFGCPPTSVGKWVFLGRNSHGYHHNLSEEYFPPFYVGDKIFVNKEVKDVNIQKIDGKYVWQVNYK